MIDRLGRLGDTETEKDAVYLQLLDPSASSEWDIGRVGGRSDISRKLLGRLSAYLRLNEVSSTPGEAEVSTTFLDWLSEMCRSNYRKPKKPKHKKGKAVNAISVSLSLMPVSPSIFEEELDHGLPTSELRKESTDMPDFASIDASPSPLSNHDDSMALIKSLMEAAVDRKVWREVDNWLQQNIHHLQMKSAVLDTDTGFAMVDIAIQLLQSFRGMKLIDEGLQSLISSDGLSDQREGTNGGCFSLRLTGRPPP
jgi:hypothetical protein